MMSMFQKKRKLFFCCYIFCSIANAQIDPSIPMRAGNIPPIRIPQPESLLESMMKVERFRQQQLQTKQLELELQRRIEDRRREEERLRLQAQPRNSERQQISSEIHPAVEEWLKAAAGRMGLYEDFEVVVFDPSLPITHDMLRLMTPRKFAADIAYYLGKNRFESLAISKMNLVEAARAIDAIEQRLKESGVR